METKLIGAVIGTLILACSSGAQATPTLSFSVDGGAAITCADGDACDLNGQTGVVTFSNTLSTFTVNVTTGLSKPLLTGNPLMDLNSINLQTALSGIHTLEILFSDTSFTSPGLISGAIGGTLSGLSSIAASAYYSTANTLFGQDKLIGALTFGSSSFNGGMPGVNVAAPLYSLTEKLVFTTNGPGLYSGDFDLKIPEPEILSLLGVALLGLGVSSRRRKPIPPVAIC